MSDRIATGILKKENEILENVSHKITGTTFWNLIEQRDYSISHLRLVITEAMRKNAETDAIEFTEWIRDRYVQHKNDFTLWIDWNETSNLETAKTFTAKQLYQIFKTSKK